MTGYVATRWYRAPEIMLNWMHYNQTGDVSPCGVARQSPCQSLGGGGGAKPRTLGAPILGTQGLGPAFTNRPSEGGSMVGLGLTPPPPGSG